MKNTFIIDKFDSSTVSQLAEFLRSNDGDIEISIFDQICCPHFVVPCYALIDASRSNGRNISISAPDHSDVAQVFAQGSLDRPFGHIWRFDNQDDLLSLFDATQKEVLKLPNIGKGFKIAFGWCLCEVMDNVLQHSQEKTDKKATGYMMIQYVPSDHLLKCCVFDLGIGLYESFLGTKHNPVSPVDAVRLAVQPSVTSGNGQGNGLYGLREIVKQSQLGRLEIKSAGARYLLENHVESAEPTLLIPGFAGTTSVDFQIYFADEFSIDRVFPDKVGTADFWMEDHEVGSDTIRLSVLEIVKGTVSRDLGREMRNAVENIIESEHKRVIIDFAGVEMCSSAFVDELIGKLVSRYQFVRFSQLVAFDHVSGINSLLIDHSLRQRLSDECLMGGIGDSFGTVCAGPTGPTFDGNCTNNIQENEMIKHEPIIVEGK